MNIEQRLLKIEETLKRIEKKLDQNSSFVEDYISEADAKEMLGRGTTWFWEQRRAGLHFYKLGGAVFYKLSDLEALFFAKV